MPDNEEPSILDYLKSKIKFWGPRQKITIPPDAQSATANDFPEEISIQEKVGQTPSQDTDKATKAPRPDELGLVGATPRIAGEPRKSWPWRSLLAVIFALLGQRAFEPSPNRTAAVGLVLYAFALAWLILAIVRKEWEAASLPESIPGVETFKVRRYPLILSIPLALAAFYFFKGNLFTPFNTTLWILAMICLIWAFWIPAPKAIPIWKRLREFFAAGSWQITVTRWALLLLAVTALVVFFRVYRINSVPGEPFSDHAEKLLDVYDVSHGQTHIFFPRNTGREGFQMYLTLVISWLLGTGLSFLSLKIGTVLCGILTMPYLYLLGKELGNKRIGLLAVVFAGIGYWPNVISRVGLRFTLYPFFLAPMLYYLIRGLRTRNRNDFILSGIFLGLGLHGYTSYRIVPLVVLIAVGIYLLHRQSRGNRKNAVMWLMILTVMSIYVFLPLARYWQENPDMFSFRTLSRMGTTEQPLPGPWWQILISNIWNALRMFNWDNGQIWVHSIPGRPALDVVSAALFLIGMVLVFVRYLRRRHWLDLFLILSIPLLQLPSTLSLAFPSENPSLNRPAGAFIPVFLIVAVAVDSLLQAIEARKTRWASTALVWITVLSLVGISSAQNYDLVFNQYATEFLQGAWNTSEMGEVIKEFAQVYGSTANAWIVPYPYWADTRLPGVWIGIPNKDFALWPQDFNSTLEVQGAKLFIINLQDTANQNLLQALYPHGVLSRFYSKTKMEGKDFMILFVPPTQ